VETTEACSAGSAVVLCPRVITALEPPWLTAHVSGGSTLQSPEASRSVCATERADCRGGHLWRGAVWMGRASPAGEALQQALA
jgi:hypothetical protein